MLFHAGSEEMEFPGISIGKYTKDFSWGFIVQMISSKQRDGPADIKR